jgi:hypothetical protein
MPKVSRFSLPTCSPKYFVSNLERNTSMSEKSKITNQCTHINAKGRRCRMLIAPDHDSLCAMHVRLALTAQPDPEVLAEEILDSTGNLQTAAEVNTLLGNVVQQFVRKRIDRRDAIALAYMSQLLLNSLPALDRQHKAEEKNQGIEEFEKYCRDVLARRRAQQQAQTQSRPQSQPSKSAPPNEAASPSPRPATPSEAPPTSAPDSPPPPRDYASVRT